MKRITVSALVALSITALPGCSYVAQNELKSSLGECLAINGTQRDAEVYGEPTSMSASASEPRQVTLEFSGSRGTARVEIVEITHFAPTQNGPGAKEAAQRLKPLANPADRRFSSVNTAGLQYEHQDGEWRIKSGYARTTFIMAGGERSERPGQTFGEAELLAGLASPFESRMGVYRSCLVDKRLTRRD